MLEQSEGFELEVERLLESEAFRTSDVLRRLLRFLADKTLHGEVEQLKEYSIAVDGLGKPPTYDTKQTTVRIHAARLRKKLSEYYQTEGKNDPLVIDLPKGHFKLTCHSASERAAIEGVQSPRVPGYYRLALLLGAGLLVALVWGSYVTFRYWRLQDRTAIFQSMWTPELQQLWQPFLDGRRPVILSIANPPFVEFKGFGVYRERTFNFNEWKDFSNAPAVEAIRKALKNPSIEQSEYYTPGGEANASFLLGKLLGPRVSTLTLVRLSDLSWQQLADNNVVYVGAARFIAPQLRAMPVTLDLLNGESAGIQNLRPRPGEPTRFVDKSQSEGIADDGEYYALITHAPGPLGTGEVETFTSARTAARLAAVQWFTDERYAQTLVDEMRKQSREIPHYYQVVLKVKFKKGVPIETKYILHHQLTPTEPVRSAGEAGDF